MTWKRENLEKSSAGELNKTSSYLLPISYLLDMNSAAAKREAGILEIYLVENASKAGAYNS